MQGSERVTITMPAEVVRDIDQLEKNRSKFVLEAVRNELGRRRREALKQSLRKPHPDSADLAEAGFDEWARSLPAEESGLVDPKAGTPVRWVPGKGWMESKR